MFWRALIRLETALGELLLSSTLFPLQLKALRILKKPEEKSERFGSAVHAAAVAERRTGWECRVTPRRASRGGRLPSPAHPAPPEPTQPSPRQAARWDPPVGPSAFGSRSLIPRSRRGALRLRFRRAAGTPPDGPHVGPNGEAGSAEHDAGPAGGAPQSARGDGRRGGTAGPARAHRRRTGAAVTSSVRDAGRARVERHSANAPPPYGQREAPLRRCAPASSARHAGWVKRRARFTWCAGR